MVSGDHPFSKIIVFWNIVLSLIEEDVFPFKVFSGPIAKVPFKVCWSLSQKEHDCGGGIHIQVINIGNFSLEFDVN